MRHHNTNQFVVVVVVVVIVMIHRTSIRRVTQEVDVIVVVTLV